MLMDADVGEGGVKNQPKSADVVYGRPLCFAYECPNRKGRRVHLVTILDLYCLF